MMMKQWYCTILNGTFNGVIQNINYSLSGCDADSESYWARLMGHIGEEKAIDSTK
jgi:hypothetical protein